MSFGLKGFLSTNELACRVHIIVYQCAPVSHGLMGPSDREVRTSSSLMLAV